MRVRREGARVPIMGVDLDNVTPGELVSELIAAAAVGEGGYVLTPNVDALRQVHESEALARVVDGAAIRVADGMPLLWASKLQGTPLSARVAGSDLIFSLSTALAHQALSVFLLGGNPGTAEAAAKRLSEDLPGLVVAGTFCPPHGFEEDPNQLDQALSAVEAAAPDFVYIGLPFGKAAAMAEKICLRLPHAWCLGLGISFSFVAGEVRRAPLWMQRMGLEWLHRLSQEPRRLVRRYVREDPPFLTRMFASALRARLARKSGNRDWRRRRPAHEAYDAATVVHHFGPTVEEIGGMASVIRTIRDLSLGAEEIAVHRTWSDASVARTIIWSAIACVTIVKLPRHALTHFHLSERGSFFREGGLLRLARLRGLITIVTLHGADFDSFASAHVGLVRSVLRSADGIVCLNPEQLSAVRATSPTSIVVTIPNAVPIDSSAPPADESGPIALFAGEIGIRKGVDVLCKAWPLVREAVPNATCTVAGPRTGFAVPDMSGLTVLGPVSPLEIKRLIKQCRCVVLPSRAEALPMFLIEAMAAGRPFVSTNVGGIPTLASGGTLVTPGDADALANAMTAYLSDSSLARAMGDAGQVACDQVRSPTTVDAALRDLYSASIAGHSTHRLERHD